MSLRALRMGVGVVVFSVLGLPAIGGDGEPVLYGIDDDSDSLVTIDIQTGAALVVGPTGFSDINGLAFDESTGTLYALDQDSNSLLTIDPETGAGSIVGGTGSGAVLQLTCLAADGDGNLYSYAGGRLASVDPMTGTLTQYSMPVGAALSGLTFDPSSGQLLRVQVITDALHTIDPVSGDGDFVGSMGSTNLQAVALETTERLLYCVEETGFLETYDPGTGALVDIIGFSGLTSITGLTFVPSGDVGCNPADFAEPFGALNFFDVSAFLASFNAGEPVADLNGDGAFDFFDVSLFLTAFAEGCP